MASTYTADNGIEKMSNGDQINTWGLTVNNNWDLVDESLDGFVYIPLTATTTTLTMPNGQSAPVRRRVIVFTGTPGGPATVTVPTLSKGWFVQNSTNVTVTLQQKDSGGNVHTTFVLNSGNVAYVNTDGNGNMFNGLHTLQLDGLQVTGQLAALQNINVTGSVTAASATFSGSMSSNGASVTGTITCTDVSVASNVVTGGLVTNNNISCGGTGSFAATVTGPSFHIPAGDVGTLIAAAQAAANAAQTTANTINSAGPANNNGFKVISAVRGESGWTILTFGTIAGSKWEIAFGSGTLAHGAVLTIPAGFSSTNFFGIASINHLDSNSNTTGVIDVSLQDMIMHCSGHDASSNTWTGTGNWLGILYRQGV